MRKIVHIDMDAFYASVEQLDNPALRGKPIIVAWRGPRSVVCAASYEARRFGVRSAMAASYAERLCPHAEFVAPNFSRYRAVSLAVRAVALRHTDLIEPLSLDEAYLDVTHNKCGFASATELAVVIRQQIFEACGLTASAGVAPNKFLAKIASDWRKPNGLFVIRPSDIPSFMPPLPVAKLPGVGAVTAAKLQQLQVQTVGDLQQLSLPILRQHFGRFGHRLFELARGQDDHPVQANRPTQSISAEDTFAEDQALHALPPAIIQLAEKTWLSAQKVPRIGRTVVLKLKTHDFKIMTRSITPALPIDSAHALVQTALLLHARLLPDPHVHYRLVGVGLANFVDIDHPQAPLF